MDFLCKGKVAVECKAISSLGVEQRQQLWNYMRLTNTPIGILYNFAPVKDQCEKYYYDVATKTKITIHAQPGFLARKREVYEILI